MRHGWRWHSTDRRRLKGPFSPSRRLAITTPYHPWWCSNLKHPCLSLGGALIRNIVFQAMATGTLGHTASCHPWRCSNLERPVRVLGQRLALAKFSLHTQMEPSKYKGYRNCNKYRW